MKITEAIELFLSGQPAFIAKYRGSNRDAQVTVDGSTGERMQRARVVHVLEKPAGSEGVLLEEFFDGPVAVTPLASRGQKLLVMPHHLYRKHGLMVCRAERSAIHVIEG